MAWWQRLQARWARFLDPACLRCGCEPEVHLHLRDGLDCGRCGRAVCRGYR